MLKKGSKNLIFKLSIDEKNNGIFIENNYEPEINTNYFFILSLSYPLSFNFHRFSENNLNIEEIMIMEENDNNLKNFCVLKNIFENFLNQITFKNIHYNRNNFSETLNWFFKLSSKFFRKNFLIEFKLTETLSIFSKSNAKSEYIFNLLFDINLNFLIKKNSELVILKEKTVDFYLEMLQKKIFLSKNNCIESNFDFQDFESDKTSEWSAYDSDL
jgi:hypothetical protein